VLYVSLGFTVILFKHGNMMQSLTLREEHRLRVCENRVLRRIFGGIKRDEVTGRIGENYIIRSLMICIPHPILFGDKIEKSEMSRACSTYGGEERHIHGFGEET
jgi:hypothetical protein